MELNTSQTSLNTEDYSLITHEKCNPPRAKLFVVFLVSLVVASIIILLVVLTRLEPSEASPRQDPSLECSDMAIIGGGLAGSYLAWRLRHTNKSVILYEKTGSLGGRLMRLDTWGDVTEEMGGTFWLPGLHAMINSTVQALGLSMTPLLPPDPVTRYYVRGQWLEGDVQCGVGCPYKLTNDEQGRSPQQLLRYLYGMDDAQIPDGFYDSENVTDWRSELNNQNLKHLLLERGSHEAYQYLTDTLAWWEFHTKGNSEVFLDYVIDNFLSGSNMAARHTLSGGMQTLVEQLVSQTLYANKQFTMKYNRQLMSIDSQNTDKSYFHFGPTDGATESELHACATEVILALPPSEVQTLGLVPEELGTTWQTLFANIIRVPLLRVSLHVTSRGHLLTNNNTWDSVRTDLPIQDVLLLGTDCVNDTSDPLLYHYYSQSADNSTDGEQLTCSTMFQINIFGDHIQYWTDLLTHDGYNYATESFLTVSQTSKFSIQLKRYLEELLSINGTRFSLPDTLSLHVKLWSASKSASAFHVWRPGLDWDTVARRVRVPQRDVKLYLVGSAYAPEYLQYWAEGALVSVDELLKQVSLT